ncbi:microsomal dipeptidase-like Zn-dependent dipeptidase/GMP synthase-like glutamine amidotransferase [Microbacterium sp. W4I4]|uniref:membrane dipeptidase n=1 Tax=Microbacterium sp. W4I4 TaxID=3042295 RepID=UPI0027831CB9|nr:membrane dipeptidase [Microbacterium sp. W4I4]MDQ0614135.1 microsomal dipeptidase-like Zn-dependent dipeptidase/GMP synthase-like glutamine amidotransferase [Microbacterium sp. W4I4]
MIPVIDGHNDLAWARRERHGYATTGLDGHVPELHTDLPRLVAGGVAGQFWSVWVDPALDGAEQVTATLEQIDFVQRLVQSHPDRLACARTAGEVRAAMAAGRIASLIGVEGGAQIDGSLAVLRQYARLGARYMTLTWSRTIDWADSATDDARHGGLTEFGREVVREMNRIGMLVDLAHVAPTTMRDALGASTRPVMVSHSGALALCDHPRNVPDDVLATIGERGGIVMVAFVPSFLSQARRDWVLSGEVGPMPLVGIADAADHIEHIREVAGVHAVGIGADYDGTDAMPSGLDDVSRYQDLLEELRRRGWTQNELEAIAHGNALRVLEASDGDYAAFLAGTAPAPSWVAPSVDVARRTAAEHPRVLVVVNAESSGPRRLGDWLREDGIRVEAVLGADGLPADLNGYDGLVMLGGGLMPDDDDRAPWLAQERELARQAIAADLPTLGICLGGQLLAHVAGGEVRASFGPKERGATVITPSPEGSRDALLGALGDAAPMIENHQDMITRLPPGAVLLASSDAVENQAFRLGSHVRGLQFHPEVGAEDLTRWKEPTSPAPTDRPVAELLAEARRGDESNTRASHAMVTAFAVAVRAAAAGRASR